MLIFNCSFEIVFLVLESIDSVLCCYSSSLLFCLWWSYSFRYIVMFVSVRFYCCNFQFKSFVPFVFCLLILIVHDAL